LMVNPFGLASKKFNSVRSIV